MSRLYGACQFHTSSSLTLKFYNAKWLRAANVSQWQYLQRMETAPNTASHTHATEIFQACVMLISHLHAWERLAFVVKTRETSGVSFVLIIHRLWLHNHPQHSPVWIICLWHVLRVHIEILFHTQHQLVCISSRLYLMSYLLSALTLCELTLHLLRWEREETVGEVSVSSPAGLYCFQILTWLRVQYTLL